MYCMDIKINEKINEKINHKNYKKFKNFYSKTNENTETIIYKPATKKQVFLTLCHWGYPPFGGGENWLIDVMTFMNKKNYECIMICFYDSINHKFYDNVNIIQEKDLTFIQMPPEYLKVVKLVKSLNPVCCHHQGLRRVEFMNLCNLLNIPFITGFCFWNDIYEMNKNYTNINIIENIQTIQKSKSFKTIYKNAITYSASYFVQEVIEKLHGVKPEIIESITLDEHFKVSYSIDNKYITIINIQYYKGGWLLNKILELDYPFLLVDTERNKKEFNVKLQEIIDKRKKNNYVHKIVWLKEKTNIKDIYKKTRILLTPSIVDESFCKIAYEGMKNKIPILSTKNGNLKFLLEGYADFLGENADDWKEALKKIYNDNDYLNTMSNRVKKNILDFNDVIEKFYNIVKNKTKIQNIQYLRNKNVGLCVPWADQGLGIQAREYYLELKKQGYNVHVMSFKPYSSSNSNVYFQTNKEEWNYENIYYYNKTREQIDLECILHFIKHSHVSSMIFIELCYDKIFNVAEIFKLLGVKIIGIPNVETTRYSEIKRHEIFDAILCNNYQTLNILTYFGLKCYYLGFSINHPFMTLKEKPTKKNIISFCCIGGLNAIKRKHIDKICEVFNEIDITNIHLNVFIQGVDYIKEKYNNVDIITKNCDYKEISNIYKTHDIFIHFGGQEGLGLGFYEALKCGTPIITIDAPPNNEIVEHEITGWLVKTTKHRIKYNAEAIIMEDIFDKDDFIKTLGHISKNYNVNMYDNVKNIKKYDYVKNFIEHLR